MTKHSNILTGLILLLANSVFGQTDLTLEGDLEVLLGIKLIVPTEASVELLPNHKITNTDSLGHFKFIGLKKGTYKLRVLGFNVKPEEFEVKLISEPLSNIHLIIDADCEVNKKIAEFDIKNKKLRILLVGGIAPKHYSNQEIVEKKYGFEYYDFGCISPSTKCIIQYNTVIFSYLDKKFGKLWKKEVRKDAIGLKKRLYLLHR